MAYCESVGQTKHLTALNLLSVVCEIIREQIYLFKYKKYFLKFIYKIYIQNR